MFIGLAIERSGGHESRFGLLLLRELALLLFGEDIRAVANSRSLSSVNGNRLKILLLKY